MHLRQSESETLICTPHWGPTDFQSFFSYPIHGSVFRAGKWGGNAGLATGQERKFYTVLKSISAAVHAQVETGKRVKG